MNLDYVDIYRLFYCGVQEGNQLVLFTLPLYINFYSLVISKLSPQEFVGVGRST